MPPRKALAFSIAAGAIVFATALCGCQNVDNQNVDSLNTEMSSPSDSTEQQSEFEIIPLDEETFPDTMLRNYLSHYYDVDGDGFLNKDEAESIRYLGEPLLCDDGTYEMERAENFPEPTTLKGLELLPSLEVLKVDASNMDSIDLDLAGFDSLITLRVEYGELNSIDTSGAPRLRSFEYSGTNVTHLDLSSNSLLIDFEWYDFSTGQSLKSLSVPPSLERISIYNAENTVFNFTECQNLEKLFLVDVVAESILLPDTDTLKTLYISDDNLVDIDLKSQQSIVGLYLSAPHISTLDLSSQEDLKYLNLTNTSITSVDLQGSSYVNESIIVSDDCEVVNTVCLVQHDDFEWPGTAYLPEEVAPETHVYFLKDSN